MINSTAVSEQEVQAYGNVIFDKDQVRTRSSKCPRRGWLSHKENSAIFDITKNGIYKIYYNANITTELAGNEIGLQLTADGEPIEGSKSVDYPFDDNFYGAISATVLITVNLNCPYEKVSIALENISEDVIKIKDANLIIDRVG